jgi:hypothetical protein
MAAASMPAEILTKKATNQWELAAQILLRVVGTTAKIAHQCSYQYYR